jgi:hypothetical protein
MGSGNTIGSAQAAMDVKHDYSIQGDITPTKRTAPSASLWTKPPSSSHTTPNRRGHGDSIRPSASVSTTPTRIPIPRPRITPTRAGPATSKSLLPPSPAISITATVATAPSTPRSSIPISTSRSRPRIPLPVSPAISIAATVATASPPPRVELSRDGSEIGSEMECESIYSSASALALARYRASLPASDNGITSMGYDHVLSRMSSTTSFSSASSLARHRNSQRHPLSSPSSSKPTQPEVGQSIPMSTNTTSTEDMALVWQPDPESTGSDPAANLWMEIEARLNRGRGGAGVGMKDERGQWVLTRQRNRQVQDRQVVSPRKVDDEYCVRDEMKDDVGREEEQERNDEKWKLGSEEMRKESSEFTVSAYFDPDLSTPIAPPLSTSRSSRSCSYVESQSGAGTGLDMEGTAIFDMAAPLVTSISTSGSEGGISATPANTPLIHHETDQRVSRVRKNYSGSRSGSLSTRMSAIGSIGMIGPRSRGRSDSSSAVVDLDQKRVPESIPMIDSSTVEIGGNRDGVESGMIRLDSHVQAALEVLSDNPESPVSNNLDIDTDQAQSSYPDPHEDGQDEISPYIELDESTPMPIPTPYDQTPTRPYPHQNQKLASRLEDSHSIPNSADEVGLGIGMNLHLDSIYSLPVLSPRLFHRLFHRATSSTSTSEGSSISSSVGPMSSDTDTTLSSRGESQDSYHYGHQDQDQKGRLHYPKDDEYREIMNQEEEEEMLTVTDLDTGHRVDLSIKRLDELWRI